MKPDCSSCKFLKMEEMEDENVSDSWVTNKYCTCSKGRFRPFGKSYQQWFAWSGIVKPNKTVKLAQTDCPFYEQK